MANRQVFPRDMVAHLWFNRSQDSARDPGGNFYFTGPHLFSYGDHFVIASHYECADGTRRILWNEDSYGVTTSRHQSAAFGAFPRGSRESLLIRVTGLNKDKAQNPVMLARALVARACGTMAGAIRKRVDNATFAYRHACGDIENARFLFINERAKMRAMLKEDGKRWNAHKLKNEIASIAKELRILPALADIPEGDDKMRLAFVRAAIAPFAAVKARQEMQGVLSSMLYTAQRAADCLESESLRSARDHVALSLDNCAKVRKLAKLAGARVPAVVVSMEKKFGPMLPGLDSRIADKNRAENISRGNYNLREAFKFKRADKSAWEVLRQANYARDHFKAAGADDEMAARLCEKMETRQEWEGVEENALRAMVYAAGARAADTTKKRADQAKSAYTLASRVPRDHFKHGNAMAALADEMRKLWQDAQIVLMEEAREEIDAWRAGTLARMPYHYSGPDLARIAGDEMQTSRGASVPLEHARRLAVVVRAAMNAGGKTWAADKMPRVGHFRLASVSADGVVIVGCHEFSEPETSRLLALLMA